MIHTETFGLRQEWIQNWISLIQDKQGISKKELANQLGLGVLQFPAFIVWMKGLDLIHEENGVIRTSKSFDTLFSSDPCFSSSNTWFKLLPKIAKKAFPLIMATWYVNYCPRDQELNAKSIIHLFKSYSDYPYSEKSLMNGFRSLSDFFRNTIVGNELGFFRGNGRSFFCSPTIPSIEVIYDLIIYYYSIDINNIDIIINLESEPGGYIHIFGDSIRKIIFDAYYSKGKYV